MKRLALSLALALITGAPAAHAQSMNVRAITQTVIGEICGPFLEDPRMWAAIGAAERAGYDVDDIWPRTIIAGAANAQPEPVSVEMTGSHAGVVRIRSQATQNTCSVGIHEGSVATMAEVAEPMFRALGMEPVLDDREGPDAISIWRGRGRQAVIAHSTEFRPGSELVMTAVVQVD